MAHKLFCEIGGHEWECNCLALHEFNPHSFAICICKTCGRPYDEGDHSQCRIELSACYECEQQQDRPHPEGEANFISVPPDADQKVERALSQLGAYEAACLWCGHGYDEFNQKAEDEHFAHNCPDAPEELRKNAKRRLLPGEHDKS
jgi:hypothetical protein